MVALGQGISRRRFLALLGALLGGAWASREEPKGEDDEKKKDREKKKDKEDKKDSKDSGERPSRLYGQVLAVHEGQVKVGAYVLQGDSPWLSWVAPGMWVEAEGRKSGERFLVQRLRILKPGRFIYYRGPGAPLGVRPSFVEAWYGPGEQTPFFLQAASPGRDVLLLAHADDWGALPLPLGLAPPAPSDLGWFLARGRWEGGRVRWLGLEALGR